MLLKLLYVIVKQNIFLHILGDWASIIKKNTLCEKIKHALEKFYIIIKNPLITAKGPFIFII